MIPRIAVGAVCGPRLLRLAFYEPPRTSEYFALARLDRVCGTVVRPNGADLVPEALCELSAIEETADAEAAGFVPS